MHRAELPLSLGPSFSTRAALDLGVSPSRLRSRDLGRPFHGVRVRSRVGEDADGPRRDRIVDLATAYAERMTEFEFFSHVTSALIWDLPLPSALLGSVALDVAVHAPRRNPAGAGIRGNEVAPSLASVRIHPGRGLRVASPASTWAMLGGVLRDVRDLIAVGDAVVREAMHPNDPPPLSSLDELAVAVGAGRRVGVGALREALPHVRTRSASRPETWTRLALVDGGLPEPESNREVFDERGALIARVDLAYPDRKVAVEYEGSQHHDDLDQWNRDILRYERLANAGWLVVRVTKAELFGDAASVVARVRRALALR